MSTHSHNHNHHAHAIDFKSAFTVTKEANSQVKITGEIPWSEVEHERKAAIKDLGAHIELDGFRKGHVPEGMLVKHIGEMRIISEMAERVIAHMYPHILEEHAIDAIGHPKVEITKLATDNPLGIHITVAVVPTVTLPDYKKTVAEINKARESDEVTLEEIETQINEILRQKMAYDRIQAKAKKETEGTVVELSEDAAATETKAADTTSDADLASLPLPELTDELVQGLGQPGQFTSVADFREKIKEHLTIQKAQDGIARHRAKITDTIVEGSTIELPQILIDSELNQMFAQMKEDLGRSNLKIEDYLKHINKTLEELKTEWTPAATKRAKLQLALNEIAKTEKIAPEEEKVAAQVKELMDHYKDADPYRVKVYVTSVLTNEAVMKRLEAIE